MEKTTKQFTYKIADDYTHLTDDNDSSASWTWKGPRFYDVECNASYIVQNVTALEDPDNFEDTLSEDEWHFLIDTNTAEGALIASMYDPNPDSDLGDSNVFPHRSIALPDGLVYKRIHPPAPDHTYDRSKVKWDTDTNKLKRPLPYFPPFISWAAVEGSLASCHDLYLETKADTETWNALSADVQQAWEDWDSDNVNKIAKYKAAGLMPHNVVTAMFPGQEDPNIVDPDDAEPDVPGGDPGGISGGTYDSTGRIVV